MINFYRRYVPNCAEIIAPLTELTKGRAPNVVNWGDRHGRAFKEVKLVLSNEQILKLPDLNREFTLQTDASNQSLGGCLLQREQNYSVGERDALAIIWAVCKFHRFLNGQHFTLESGHRPLEYLQSSHPKIQDWWGGVWYCISIEIASISVSIPN